MKLYTFEGAVEYGFEGFDCPFSIFEVDVRMAWWLGKKARSSNFYKSLLKNICGIYL